MLHTITFGALSAILLDFVDHGDGFLYLRMAGAEPTVNAIWAKLSAKEGRGKKWNSPVQIPLPGQSYPKGVAAQKGTTYRTLRTRLPSGLIDLALLHPILTVAEDSERGFYLLTYEDGVPSGFFERLNRTLSIPLDPAWADWLWDQGQHPQSRFTLRTQTIYENGQPVEQEQLLETTDTPITRLDSLGHVDCYRVRCNEGYTQAWLQIIRDQLGLGIRLKAAPHPAGREPSYQNGPWCIQTFAAPEGSGWQLTYEGERLAQAPSLNHLVTQAREHLGLHFIIEQEER